MEVEKLMADNNKGRPKLCTLQDLRSTKREINVLRETVGTFTSNILQEEAGVNGSNSTFRRTLRRMGCGYRRTRKEGMLTRRDKLKKFKFVKKVKKLFSHHDRGSRVVWTRRISMYADGVGKKSWIFIQVEPLFTFQNTGS